MEQSNDNTIDVVSLQQQLIETQQKLIATQKQVIKLQKRIDKLTPKNLKDEDIFWHIASGGIMSDEAANSSDITMLRGFESWLNNFAKKYIKPYVNPKVYSECVNQMTRGLPTRIADLQTRDDIRRLDPNKKYPTPLVRVR
jgi:hypothetical protein